LWQASFWPTFFLGILLLLFSFGRSDWRGTVARLVARLREGQAENVWLMMESEGFVSGGEGEPGQGFWLAWCRYTGYRYLDGIFTVLFWFFLLGPVAAVFYRLVSLYNNHPQVLAGNLPAFTQCQYALEWLPVRYMALCCCLAGNFTTGFRVCQQLALDTRLSSADVLAKCLDASWVQETWIMENPADVPADVDESLRLVVMRSPALQALLERTEIIGLVGLAFAILVFH
jgi:membrane protein required for beta-lactamase induction